MTGGQRRRLLRGVNGACDALNWMQGEGSRSVAHPHSLVPPRTRLNVFVLTCSSVSSWRLCVWVDADSAVVEHEALAKLVKDAQAPGVSSNVGYHEYPGVSLPHSVGDAPPLIETLCLRRQDFSRGVSVTDAVAA